MEQKFKLSEESANEQYKLIIDYYDLEFIEAAKEQADEIKRVLIRAIQRGQLEVEVTDQLQITHNLRNSSKIVYNEMNALARTKVLKLESNAEKIYGLLAACSGEPVANIHKLGGIDLRIAEHLGALFLAL